MKELTARQVRISDPFWSPRLDVNAKTAIFHQWKQLEDTRCIDDIRKLLATGAGELGVILTDEQVGACMSYLEELKKWNRKINLTAIRDDREAVIKHFLDSFSFLPSVATIVPTGVNW